jgi:hypothetical protein
MPFQNKNHKIEKTRQIIKEKWTGYRSSKMHKNSTWHLAVPLLKKQSTST